MRAQTPLTDPALRALHGLTQLQSLDISHSNATSDAISQMCSKLSILRALRLNDCLTVTDDLIESFEEKLQRLELLWLGGPFTHMTDRSLAALGRMTTLEDLHISVPLASAGGLRMLRSLTKLTALTVEHGHMSFMDARNWTMLADFPLVHLQVMDTIIDRPELEKVCAVTTLSCIHLHAVHLNFDAAKMLVDRLSRLEHIELHGGRMERRCIGEFARLSSLQSLLVSRFFSLRDADFLPLRSLQSLTLLEITECGNGIVGSDELLQVAPEVNIVHDANHT